MKVRSFDFIVVGSGFAGALMAMLVRRAGYTVALVERGQHPRFAIGESSTPLANLLLEEIADEFELPFLRTFSKWGTWQKEHPKIGCGLKRGFTFYHHRLGEAFPIDPVQARSRQLMVGASPADHVADTHWYRPDFDHYLVRQAKKLGATYIDKTEIIAFSETAPGVSLTANRGGRRLELTAKFLFDASGPRGFLHRTLALRERELDFPHTQALFAHFSDVQPLPRPFIAAQAPYPAESAAVHHVFDGGWIWVLRFNNGITSAGVAATDAVAKRFDFSRREAAWRNVLRELPSLQRIFRDANAQTPFVWQPRIAFQSEQVAGKHWALLPSAAGVIDPLLSTGFPLALLGIQRLGRLLKSFGTSRFAAGLQEYAELTTAEFEITAGLVKGLYARMGKFDAFADLTLMYFAAASYSELARRLGKPELARQYLLADRPEFLKTLRRFSDDGAANTGVIRRYIKPIDVAGLTDRQRHPWYPAQASDTLRNASKLNATPAEIRALLKSLGVD